MGTATRVALLFRCLVPLLGSSGDCAHLLEKHESVSKKLVEARLMPRAAAEEGQQFVAQRGGGPVVREILVGYCHHSMP